jgi:Tfp pilus assembly protein PilO
MTGRDRMVLIGVVVLVALGAAWMLVVSPERKKADELGTKVAAAQTQLATAESAVSSARAAQSQYAAAYTAIVNLGKAVPPSQEVPALIDQIAQASNQKSINFTSITSTGTSGAATSTSTSSSSSPPASSASAASASASAAAPAPVPFSFVFEGSYFDLEHLLSRLTDFTTLTPAGDLQVSGRLLTIQSVALAPGVAAEGAKGTTTNLTGSITATAYMMPAGQGLASTGAAATTPGAASPASSTGSAPTSPAIVKVNP